MRSCRDCGAEAGALHIPGCDVERCPRCGGQQIGCDCVYEVSGLDPDTLEEEHPEIFVSGPTAEMGARWDAEWGARRMPWTGEYPGLEACRELGLWCRENPGGTPYWVPCEAGYPDVREDLNRLHITCRWDAVAQRWRRR